MASNKPLLITDRSKIRKALKKSDEQVETDKGIIKSWFKTQKHLPETPNDNTIEFFLTLWKYDIEKTKQSLDTYYTARDLMPDIYDNKHPGQKNMKQVNDVVDIYALPTLTEDLRRITIVRFKDVDPEKFNIDDYSAAFFRNSFEIKTNEDLFLGQIYVFDFKYFKLEEALKLTPMVVKKYAFICEKIWADSVDEMHFINSPPYADTVINLARTLYSKKLREHLFVHEKVEDIFKTIPRDLMPSDYGGNGPSLSELSDSWNKKFDEYKDRFTEMDKLKVNEDLRQNKKDFTETLGYLNNFKNIDVD